MIACEFETESRDGTIRIPEKYKKVMAGKIKIIMLKQDESPETSRKKRISNIKKYLKKIQEKKIFNQMEDPMRWQRNLRNEWK